VKWVCRVLRNEAKCRCNGQTVSQMLLFLWLIDQDKRARAHAWFTSVSVSFPGARYVIHMIKSPKTYGWSDWKERQHMSNSYCPTYQSKNFSHTKITCHILWAHLFKIRMHGYPVFRTWIDALETLWEKSTLRQIPAPPDHFAQVEDFFVNEKKKNTRQMSQESSPTRILNWR
jgi:hypothetical protein